MKSSIWIISTFKHLRITYLRTCSNHRLTRSVKNTLTSCVWIDTFFTTRSSWSGWSSSNCGRCGNGSRVRPKLSATASKNNLKTSTVLSCDDVKIYCQRCCVSYVKSDTDVKHTCFMQPDSARRQLGQGRAMVFFDMESCVVNWIVETKYDTMSKTIWIIPRLSILFHRSCPTNLRIAYLRTYFFWNYQF